MLPCSILQYNWPALSYHMTFVLSIFEWLLKTGFTVKAFSQGTLLDRFNKGTHIYIIDYLRENWIFNYLFIVLLFFISI